MFRSLKHRRITAGLSQENKERKIKFFFVLCFTAVNSSSAIKNEHPKKLVRDVVRGVDEKKGGDEEVWREKIFVRKNYLQDRNFKQGKQHLG